jgi:hypothetical protein
MQVGSGSCSPPSPKVSCRQIDLGCIAGNICMEHEDVVAGNDAFKQA